MTDPIVLKVNDEYDPDETLNQSDFDKHATNAIVPAVKTAPKPAAASPSAETLPPAGGGPSPPSNVTSSTESASIASPDPEQPAKASFGVPKIDSSDGESESESEDDTGMYEGLTEEQKQIMKAKFAKMQETFDQDMKRQHLVKVTEVKNTMEFFCDSTITEDLAEFVLDFTARHDINMRAKLEDDPKMFLALMRELFSEGEGEKSKKTKDGDYNVDDEADSGRDDEDVSLVEEVPLGEDFAIDVPDAAEDWVKDAVQRKVKHKLKKAKLKVKTGMTMQGKKRVGRLTLDNALKDKNSMEGWSEARKKAFKNVKKNPNAYYYRFNEPGEKQGNGAWSDEEHRLFMLRMKELGVNNKWGTFSMKIPGRVGYQCSNYYRQLVKEGTIVDSNYFWDGKKLHFKRGVKAGKDKEQFEAERFYNFTVMSDKSGVWKNCPARHGKAPKIDPNKPKGELTSVSKIASAAPKKRKRTANKRQPRKRRKKDDDDGDSDCEHSVNTNDRQNDNPLPDFIDPIDGQPVVQPAISPYGHVCGYANWTKMLRQEKTKNICPFTKRPLTRRQLVKLTTENFDEYKDKIKNRDSS